MNFHLIPLPSTLASAARPAAAQIFAPFLDRETGVKYSEAEFLDYYGAKKGAKIWAAAGRAAEAEKPAPKKKGGKAEKRMDPDAGVKYTEEEFIEYYGKKK